MFHENYSNSQSTLKLLVTTMQWLADAIFGRGWSQLKIVYNAETNKHILKTQNNSFNNIDDLKNRN